ncbi:MAG: hypothetical protein AAFQ92_18155 [Bacteroidota bacterium]
MKYSNKEVFELLFDESRQIIQDASSINPESSTAKIELEIIKQKHHSIKQRNIAFRNASQVDAARAKFANYKSSFLKDEENE